MPQKHNGLQLPMKFLLVLVFITGVSLISHADAASIYKDKGVGISIEKSLLKSGKLKYSDIIPYDNSTKYSGMFEKSANDVRRHTIASHNNISPYEFSTKFYVIVDPPSSVQNRFPLIIIVSNLDSFHSQAQLKTIESKVSPDAKARSLILSSSTMRWVNESCREAKIAWSNWQVLLPDTILYLKSGCDPNSTKISTISNQTIILTKHDISTSSKYKLQSFYDTIKEKCLKSRNACTSLENRAVTTMGDSK